MEQRHEPDDGERKRGQPARESTDVLHPATAFQADDVEEKRDDKQHERCAGSISGALLEARKMRAEDVEGEYDGRKRQRGKVEDIGRPIEPAGEKPLAGSECLRGPNIQI